MDMSGDGSLRWEIDGNSGGNSGQDMPRCNHIDQGLEGILDESDDEDEAENIHEVDQDLDLRSVSGVGSDQQRSTTFAVRLSPG